MNKKRKKSTRDDFLKACKKNGIVFSKSSSKKSKSNYIHVVDDNGDVIKMTRDFNIFVTFRRLWNIFKTLN